MTRESAPYPFDDDIERVLDVERARSARWMTLFRTYVAVACLLLVGIEAYVLQRETMQSHMPVVIGYTLATVGLGVAARSSPTVARQSWLALGLLDIPMLGALLVLSHRYSTNPSASIMAALAATLTTLQLTQLSMERLNVAAVGAAAVLLLGSALVAWGDAKRVTIVLLTLGGSTSLSLYATGWIKSVMHRIARDATTRARLDRHFSRAVAAQIVASTMPPPPAEKREVTLLIADIHGVTAIAETMEGREVVSLLNAHLARMVDLVFRHGGTLDKFIGDGLIAYFGAPLGPFDHEERAVACARDIVEAIEEINSSRGSRAWPEVQIAIGVHTGVVVLGDIGSERRREYTAVGEAVHVASRVQQLARERTAFQFSCQRQRANESQGEHGSPHLRSLFL